MTSTSHISRRGQVTLDLLWGWNALRIASRPPREIVRHLYRLRVDAEPVWCASTVPRKAVQVHQPRACSLEGWWEIPEMGTPRFPYWAIFYAPEDMQVKLHMNVVTGLLTPEISIEQRSSLAEGEIEPVYQNPANAFSQVPQPVPSLAQAMSWGVEQELWLEVAGG